MVSSMRRRKSTDANSRRCLLINQGDLLIGIRDGAAIHPPPAPPHRQTAYLSAPRNACQSCLSSDNFSIAITPPSPHNKGGVHERSEPDPRGHLEQERDRVAFAESPQAAGLWCFIAGTHHRGWLRRQPGSTVHCCGASAADDATGYGRLLRHRRLDR